MILRLIKTGFYDLHFMRKNNVIRVPSGWIIEKLDIISGQWIYHMRCHPKAAVAYMQQHDPSYEPY